MKNLSNFNVSELSNTEMKTIEGGDGILDLINDVVDAYNTAKDIYDSLKKFTPTL